MTKTLTEARAWLEHNPEYGDVILEEIDRYNRILQSLTPGGSEFVRDPERCRDAVLASRSSLMNGMRAWARRALAAEAEAAMLELALEPFAMIGRLEHSLTHTIEPGQIYLWRLSDSHGEQPGITVEDVRRAARALDHRPWVEEFERLEP